MRRPKDHETFGNISASKTGVDEVDDNANTPATEFIGALRTMRHLYFTCRKRTLLEPRSTIDEAQT